MLDPERILVTGGKGSNPPTKSSGGLGVYVLGAVGTLLGLKGVSGDRSWTWFICDRGDPGNLKFFEKDPEALLPVCGRVGVAGAVLAPESRRLFRIGRFCTASGGSNI